MTEPASRRARLLLAAALLAVLALRLIGLDYGLPQLYRADEMDLPGGALQVLASHSPRIGPVLLYPPFAAYCFAVLLIPFTALHYMLQGCPPLAEFREFFVFHPGDIWLYLRYCSVAIGFIVMWLIYRIGAQLFSPRAGALAALVLGFSFNQQQMATITKHWLFAYLATVMVLWLALQLPRGRRFYLWSGFWAAMGYATNFFSGSLIIIPLLNHCYFLRTGEVRDRWRAPAWCLLVFAAACGVIYWLHPYPYMIKGHNIQAAINCNYIDGALATVMIFIGKISAFWQFCLMFDPLATIGGLLGCGLLLAARRWRPLLLLAYGPLYFVIAIALLHEINPRYQSLTPLVLAIFAGYFIDWVWSQAATLRRTLMLGLVVLLTALSVMHIARWDWLMMVLDSRELLDEYIVTAIPPDARIAVHLPAYNLVNGRVFPSAAALQEFTDRGWYPKQRQYYRQLLALPPERYPRPSYWLYEVSFASEQRATEVLARIEPDFFICEPLADTDPARLRLQRDYALVHTIAPAATPAAALTNHGRQIDGLHELLAIRRMGPWIEIYRRRH